MTKIKSITIFGSSQIKEGSGAWSDAYQTGLLLARAGFRVVNGGYEGSMAASARGAKEAGGATVGITTAEFANSPTNPFIDEELRAPKWHERLFQLMERGDGFVVLDGGTGTLVELIVCWEMANKHFHEKPTVVLGKRMQAAVTALKENAEVEHPKQLYFSGSPEETVQILKDALSHD